MSVAALVACALTGVLLGTGAFTVRYAEGFSYLSNDPKACVNCHIMRDQYDGWQRASHHAVATCNYCHVPHETVPKYLVKAENGFWHSKGFTLRKAQWRVDFINAENSMGFHASQESARVLGEAIDYARQGQIKVLGSKVIGAR
jgi:cytochrome c nitrite reductase small subunit